MVKARKKGGNARHVTANGGEGFWNRPALMNLISDLLLLGGGFMLIWVAAIWLQRLPAFPLRQLVVVTPIAKVSRQQLEHVARTAVAGNFFTVDLAAAQAVLEVLPWVRRAEVRRRWPDALEVTLEEHDAAAHWTPLEGEPRLVNTHGEVFVATSDAAELPRFSGPEGSAVRVLERFTEFKKGLNTIGRVPVSVHLSPREAWRLKLDDGVALELGRDQSKHPVADRLARFSATYSIARSRIQAVFSVVDMRYPNGFAVRAGGKS